MGFVLEAKGKDNYQKLEYQKVGKTGNIVDQIDEIINWMECNGLSAGVSRYSKYKRYIKDCDLDSDRMRSNVNTIMLPEEYIEIFNKASDSIKELVQIERVFKCFKEEKSHGFWEKMKKIVSGKEFYDGESNDPARNYLYELLVAARYKSKGYDIDFDSSTNTDVVGRRGGSTICIECKRLKSSKSYEENYRKACNQLKKINDEEVVKLVYIDVYNCLKRSQKKYDYSDLLMLHKSEERLMIEEFEKTVFYYTNNILNEFKQVVDGVVFTTYGMCGINNNIIENEFVCKEKVWVYEDISDVRYGLVVKMMN